MSMPIPASATASSAARWDNYNSYLDILRQPLPGVDDVSPDYKTQASALLLDQPIDFGMTGGDDSLADYFRDYL